MYWITWIWVFFFVVVVRTTIFPVMGKQIPTFYPTLGQNKSIKYGTSYIWQRSLNLWEVYSFTQYTAHEWTFAWTFKYSTCDNIFNGDSEINTILLLFPYFACLVYTCQILPAHLCFYAFVLAHCYIITLFWMARFWRAIQSIFCLQIITLAAC